MYLDIYKSNISIFERIPKLDLGGVFLRGFLMDNIEIESKVYHINSSDSLVEKYLPGACSKSEEDAKQKVLDLTRNYLLKLCVPFVIASSSEKVPLGYIVCNTPLYYSSENYDEKIDDWTIDFWLNESVRGKKIMYHALYCILGYLQSNEVERVYIFIDKDNYPSIRIIEKCDLIFIKEVDEGKKLKYGVALKPNISL